MVPLVKFVIFQFRADLNYISASKPLDMTSRVTKNPENLT